MPRMTLAARDRASRRATAQNVIRVQRSSATSLGKVAMLTRIAIPRNNASVEMTTAAMAHSTVSPIPRYIVPRALSKLAVARSLDAAPAVARRNA